MVCVPRGISAAWLIGMIALLSALSGCEASSVASVRGVPLDLYLLLDQSGSIETSDWKKIVRFGSQLRVNLADKIGYYQDGVSNGLRVCLITFVCTRGDNIFTRIRFEPTGDVAEMDEKFSRLLTLPTGGETCMGSALRSVDNFISQSNALEPPLRKSVLLFLTDGRFDDFGSNAFQSSLNSIQSNPNSATFAVGIGRTDESQLRSAAGGKDNVFQVEDANSLTEITSTLTAFIFGDFSAQIARKSDLTLINGNEDTACIGTDLVVILTGETIFSLDPDTQQIDCDLTLPGASAAVTSPARLTNDLWMCDIPASYTQLDKANVELVVFTRNNGEPVSSRRKIRDTTFILTLASCVSFDSTSGPCLGGAGNLSISGETLEAMSSIPGATLECGFQSDDFSGELTSVGHSKGCPFPAVTADWVAAQSAQVSTPLGISQVSIRITLPGIENTIELAQSQLERADGSACAAPSLSASPVCFADSNTMQWQGSSVAWGVKQSGWDFICKVAIGEVESQLPASAVDGTEDSVACTLPADKFSMVAVTGPISSRLVLTNKNSDREVPVSETTAVDNEVVLCGGLVPLEQSICLGEEARARIEVLNNGATEIFNGGSITCRFIDKENEVEFNSIAQAGSDGRFFCLGEEFNQNSLGVRYDVVQLRFEQFVVAEFPLDVASDACFVYQARVESSDPWQAFHDTGSFEVCYGKELASAEARISGRSAMGLVQANVSVECRFGESTTVPAEAIKASSGDYLLCSFPSSVFNEAQSSIEVIVQKNIIADKKDIVTFVGGRPPCVTSAVRSRVANGFPLCLGSSLEATFHGETIEHLLSGLSTGDISRVLCVFEGDALSDAYAIENEGIGCKLPEGVTNQLGDLPAQVFHFRVEPSGEAFESELSSFRILAQEDENCVSAAHTVETTGGDNVENPSRFCAGEALFTRFTGTSIENISAPTLACVYTSSTDTPPKTSFRIQAVRDGTAVKCEMPQWSPFLEESRMVLDLQMLALVIEETGTTLYSIAIPQSSVCMSVASHGIDESMRPSESKGNRQLATDCWPSCCRRSHVEIGFEGASVRLFGSEPSRVRCAYVSNENELGVNPDTNKVELIPRVINAPANIAGNRLSCGVVEGWKLNSSAGDYKSVAVQILSDSLAEVEAVVHTFEYPSSTASKTCIHTVYSSQVCLGRREEYPLTGVTLLALLDEFPDLTDRASCSSGRGHLNVTHSGPQTITCFKDSSTVLQLQTLPETSLRLKINNELFFSEAIGSIDFSMFDSCLRTLEATRYCHDSLNSSVHLVAAGSALSFIPVADFLCTFTARSGFSSDATPSWLPDGSLQCQLEASSTEYAGFTISSQGSPLLQGTLVGSNCPEDEPVGLSVGVIAGIAAGGAAFVGIAFVLLCCCVKRRKQREGKDKDIYLADGIHSPEESPDSDVLFRDGERIEGRLGYSMDPERNDWYKGIVAKVVRGDNGVWYDVLYDDPSLGKEENITQAAVRSPKTDFRVGQRVEVRVKSEEDKWLVAEIHAVRKNDCYHVKFVSDKEDELDLPGNLMRIAQIQPEYNLGDIVGVAGERGVVQDVHRSSENDVILYAVLCSTDPGKAELREEVPESDISPWKFAVGDIVHVQDANDPKILRQGSVRSISNQNKYSVQHDDNTIGVEEGIGIARLFKPQFTLGSLVETCDRSKENWSVATVEERVSGDRYRLREIDAKGEFTVGVDRIRLRIDRAVQEPQEEECGVWRPPARHVDLDALPDGPGTMPKHLRFKRKKPLAYRDLPNNQFEVTLDMSEGLGVSLGWTNDDKVIVAGFKDLTNGDWGPVEACGLVGLKDMLLEVNGKDINGCSFREVSDIIHEASGKPITLRFGRYTGDGPTRKTLMTESQSARDKDSGIRIPTFVDENSHTNITET